MREHGLSESRVRRTIHSPHRIEKGIVPHTIVFMKREKAIKKEYEIWVMITNESLHRKVISAWRYPGVTSPNEPIPKAILMEMNIKIAELL